MRLTSASLERRFSVERLLLLMRNRLYDEVPLVLIGAAIALGLNALSLLLGRQAFFNIHALGGGGAWTLVIALAGILLAANSLKAMHDGRGQTDWLLLPATSVEKYMAALADTVLVFPVAGAAISIALSALLALVEGLIGGPGNPIWIPGIETLRAWGGLAIAATIFVAGSATFRKTSFLKTGGIVLGFAFAWALALTVLLVLIRFGGWENLGSFSLVNGRFLAGGDSVVTQEALRVMQIAMDIAVYAFVPAFAILFGAFKVAEKEAKDEVQ